MADKTIKLADFRIDQFDSRVEGVPPITPEGVSVPTDKVEQVEEAAESAGVRLVSGDSPDSLAPAATGGLADLLEADLASTLEAAGYTTADQLRAATDEELDAVSGIGPKSVEKIRAAGFPGE